MALSRRPSDSPMPSITAAELEVMKILWARGPLAARDVIAALPAGRDWAPKTVKTLLARLVAKGALNYEQVGNSYLYRAAVTREQVTRREVRGFVERVLDGSLMPILHFIEGGRELTDEEQAQLRRVLDRQGAAGTKSAEEPPPAAGRAERKRKP